MKDHSRVTCVLLYSLTRVRVAVIAAWALVVVLSIIRRVYQDGIEGFSIPRHDWFLFALTLAIFMAIYVTIRWSLKEFDRWARRRYEREC